MTITGAVGCSLFIGLLNDKPPIWLRSFTAHRRDASNYTVDDGVLHDLCAAVLTVLESPLRASFIVQKMVIAGTLMTVSLPGSRGKHTLAVRPIS